MGYNDITLKLETALQALVNTSGLTGLTVNTGIEEEGLEVPFVVCSVTNFQQEILYSATYRCNASVLVASSADDDARATHKDRVSVINDLLADDAIAETLSGLVDDFHVVHVAITGGPSEMANRQMRNYIELEVVCSGGDIE